MPREARTDPGEVMRREDREERGKTGRIGTQHNTAQHNTAQHSTAQHSTAQHSTAQHNTQMAPMQIIPLPLRLRTPSCYYGRLARVGFVSGNEDCLLGVRAKTPHDTLTIQDGASIYIAICTDALRVQAQHNPIGVKTLCKHFFPAGCCGSYNEAWLLQAIKEGRDFMTIHKLHGLTHPKRPFAVSAMPIVIDSHELISEVREAVREFGQDLETHEWALVPFSFPPALCDIDKNLQIAHCRLALGCNKGRTIVTETTTAYAQELLGESIAELVELL